MSDTDSDSDPDREPASAFWRRLLEEQGVTPAELARAEETGTLQLLALERSILLDQPRFDVVEAGERSGIEVAEIRRFWRALGFPDPQPGERLFTRTDVDMLAAVTEYIREGELELDLALQMARVIGSSLARIATAQVEAAQVRRGQAGADRSDPREQAQEVQRSAELVPMLATVLDTVWRRHLAVAVGRQMARDESSEERQGVTVGFADLEGFTALAQQLPEDELADVVDRFETLAYDVVSAHAGRVVKTIGDEVMFKAEDVTQGAEIALALAEAYAADEALSDVRVGLATGAALELEGDLYGPAVNLASRMVSIAYPGTVLASKEVAEALGDAPEFQTRPLRPHHLKHIGRVRPVVLRRATEEESEQTLARARRRRRARERWIAERMAERLGELPPPAGADD